MRKKAAWIIIVRGQEMPAFFTHRAAGQRVLDKLHIDAVTHRKAFLLGCQGPDIFYSNKRAVKSGITLGLAMHNQKTRQLLTHIFDFLKKYDKKDKDELISYLAGFLVHYTVDKITHPFIYKKSGRNFGAHHAMEYMWDSYTTKQEWNLEAGHIDVFSDVMYGELSEGILEWYASVTNDVYNRSFKQDTAKKAHLRFAKSKQRMFTNPSFTKKLFFRMTTGVNSKEMLYPHDNEHELFSREDFGLMQNMILESVNEAYQFIRFMLKYMQGSEIQLFDRFVDKDFHGEQLYVQD